jgi:hypothetical protein
MIKLEDHSEQRQHLLRSPDAEPSQALVRVRRGLVSVI